MSLLLNTNNDLSESSVKSMTNNFTKTTPYCSTNPLSVGYVATSSLRELMTNMQCVPECWIIWWCNRNCSFNHALHYLYCIMCIALRVLHYMYCITCVALCVLHYVYCITCITLRVSHYVCCVTCTALHVLHYVYCITCTALRVLHYVSNKLGLLKTCSHQKLQTC